MIKQYLKHEKIWRQTRDERTETPTPKNLPQYVAGQVDYTVYRKRRYATPGFGRLTARATSLLLLLLITVIMIQIRSKHCNPSLSLFIIMYSYFNFFFTSIQCRHLIPALNAWAVRAYYTTARPIDTQFHGHGCVDFLQIEHRFY